MPTARRGGTLRLDFWNPEHVPGWTGTAYSATTGRLLDRIRSAGDFADLLGEVLGELGTSHAYVTAAWDGTGDHPPVGQLGATSPATRPAAGWWTGCCRASRPTRGARSPLEAPGVAAGPGDELVAVDGQPVDPRRGPWPLLAGTAGKPVELVLRPRDADPEVQRRVVVVPLRSDRRLRYQDWVASRRRLVRELSDGRLGYLHIPDMRARAGRTSTATCAPR